MAISRFLDLVPPQALTGVSTIRGHSGNHVRLVLSAMPLHREARFVPINFGLVSTYPPTRCGLATFTASLRRALVASGDTGRVIEVLDTPDLGRQQPPEVMADVVAGRPASHRYAAELLNRHDVAVIQHEYGIYGGENGAEVLPLLAALTVPSVVVLHTVLREPTVHQREVLEAVVALASVAVTMTVAARDRLAAGYAVDLSKVAVIPHGAATPARRPVAPVGSERLTVLTWGLIGPGKGIEWAVDSMALLQDLTPVPHYLVAGHTHPKVLLQQGESYRNGLQKRVARLGLTDSVTLDDRYLDDATLAQLVASADVVLLPYDSTEQVTSGVLIEAVAALKPVVATRFPHAVELLSGGAGLLVPQRDPVAIAAALRTLLTRADVRHDVIAAAAATAPGVPWADVADEYRSLAARLIRGRVTA